jgi:hypothetical protein
MLFIYKMNKHEFKYYGQIRQDQFVVGMTRYKKDGYYVEIGANDPMVNNNTLCLEMSLGWRGLESSPEIQFLVIHQKLFSYSALSSFDAQQPVSQSEGR